MASKRKTPDGPSASEKKSKLETKGDYKWEQLHAEFESGNYIGTYGGCNSAWHALAGLRAGTDLKSYHKKRSPDEFYIESFDTLLKTPSTRRRWDDVITFDPLGMYASPPTMAGTICRLEVAELKEFKLTPDGIIVNNDGSVNASKLAIDYVWNLPAVANRLKLPEDDVRRALSEYTQNEKILDKSKKCYLPPLGGLTIYFFGDVTKLSDPSTEVAVRVHDSCCGSDVFGSDICTCRPYLIFAISGAVECAQRGGVGLVVYFQKEGRSLGEVTKFRVYNARKRQSGGDRAETYFLQTESIAGIRDARFQELMPDVLLWLGIERINWLLSMSSDKYDAITAAGIDVMQRVSIPDMYVPKAATVELTAKISAGYHTESIVSEDLIANLRQLEAVRSRCQEVYQMAKENKTRHFILDLSKIPVVVDYVYQITIENYPDLNIPYHSRWRHFDSKLVNAMTSKWTCSKKEKIRRLVDLVTVSVLLDAGTGKNWKYIDHHGHVLNRSEGLAAATFTMFRNGLFSSDVSVPHRVNAAGLKALTYDQFRQGFQENETNEIIGLKDRFQLLKRLGKALESNADFFGKEVRRPGNLVNYVLKHVKDQKVSVKVAWKCVIEGLESIWPEHASGVRRGDVWAYSPLKQVGQPASDMVPFHKLSQWLTYSLLEPFEEYGIQFTDLNLLTGLPEYRNGGLFIDLGVLRTRAENAESMEYDVGAELMVELRALTVCLLDVVAEAMRKKLGKTEAELPLAKVLQGDMECWTCHRCQEAS